MRPYESLVRRLYQVNLYNPAKMGLTNIQRLHDALGNPMDGLPAIHIAGTNGKGSVALKIARSLELGGIRTGLFVSPHVSCFRERMQVNGELISEAGVEDVLPKIFQLCEAEDIPATFFEITTALAFQHFRNSNVEAVVIEAGLGGQKDSTNIITPKLSIITSVGLDHTHILGDTVEKIAIDKAGIIKPGVPALVGEGCPVELLRGVASQKGAPFYRWMDAFPDGAPPLPLDFDEENTRLAEAGLRLLWRTNPEFRVEEEALRKGTSQRPPCRFEVVQMQVQRSKTNKTDYVRQCTGMESWGTPVGGGEGGMERNHGGRSRAVTTGETSKTTGGNDLVTVVLDVAHNPPAIERFLEKVRREFPRRRVRAVAAFSGDKDSRVCLEKILAHAGPHRIHVAEASTPRAMPTEVLASTLTELSGGAFDAARRARFGDDSVRQAIRDALTEAANSGTEESPEKDLVVVVGTVFMMVDARQELGFDEPRDSPVIAEVAGSHFRAAQDNIPMSGSDG